jgi:hypothetical protein
MKMPRSLLGKFTLFAVLGLTDLVLTCYLLRTVPGWIYESNPVAQWWLVRWGWAGLAGFKLAVMLLVMIAVSLIARYRPRTAGHVLSFACAATALVVGYSCTLLGSTRVRCPAQLLTREDEVRIRSEAAQLDAQVRQLQAYYKFRDQLAEDLNAGRHPLDELVTRLAATPEACDPAWLAALRRAHPGRSDRERMAELILYYARLLVEKDSWAASAEEGAGHPGKPPLIAANGAPQSGGRLAVAAE